MCSRLWIPQVISRDKLLRESCKVGREFGFSKIHYYTPVLPNIVVIVMIVHTIVQELPARPLIHVDIMNTVTIRVLTAEDINVVLIRFGGPKQTQQRGYRFDFHAAIHGIALPPR